MTKTHQSIIIFAVGAWASLAIVVAGAVVHLAWRFVFASVLVVLLITGYIWLRLKSARKSASRFRTLIKGSLVFFCGTLYGVVELARDGWSSADLLALAFPMVMTVYLLWAAVKAKRKDEHRTSNGISPQRRTNP